MVSSLHQTYRDEGLDKIPDKPKSGRPPWLNVEQRSALKEIILGKVPLEVGFPTVFNWTTGLIAKNIAENHFHLGVLKCEFGFDYSIRGITGMLDRMGLSYTGQPIFL